MAEEPITKADLEAALANAVREIKEYVLTTVVQEIKEYVDERTHDAETRLLRAFSDFNTGLGVRMRKIEADVSNIDTASTTRLGNLENKITDMDIRLIRLEGGGLEGRKTS